MSESKFLLTLGISLWALLAYSAYFGSLMPLYIFIGYLLFEGITNLRLFNISKLFSQTTIKNEPIDSNGSILNYIEADRALRIVIAAIIYIALLFPNLLWFLPWFISGMLIMAGITNICPMNLFLKWAGFR